MAEPIIVYLAHLVGTIRLISTLVSVGLFAICVIAFFALEYERIFIFDKYRKTLKKMLYIAIVALVITCVLPSKTVFLEMFYANNVSIEPLNTETID